jgi:hypothetical protein
LRHTKPVRVDCQSNSASLRVLRVLRVDPAFSNGMVPVETF